MGRIPGPLRKVTVVDTSFEGSPNQEDTVN